MGLAYYTGLAKIPQTFHPHQLFPIRFRQQAPLFSYFTCSNKFATVILSRISVIGAKDRGGGTSTEEQLPSLPTFQSSNIKMQMNPGNVRRHTFPVLFRMAQKSKKNNLFSIPPCLRARVIGTSEGRQRDRKFARLHSALPSKRAKDPRWEGGRKGGPAKQDSNDGRPAGLTPVI
ncbi:hypothetical protein CEXT_114301 [Caerostris extrusa]|uniref:Uncharacterized protein n=1 Tax=Caerostris extrusa TaxID=172846 RepID=A0AAV4Y7V0_CAEEX|nr:hypothetical protein CEXT_114301 [Caerostris extrusa]